MDLVLISARSFLSAKGPTALSQILCKRLKGVKRGEIVVAGGGSCPPPLVSKIAKSRRPVKGAEHDVAACLQVLHVIVIPTIA